MLALALRLRAGAGASSGIAVKFRGVFSNFSSRMGSNTSKSSGGGGEGKSVESQIKEEISSNTCVVYSKTWCGYCKRAKQVLRQHLAEEEVLTKELDTISEGREIQTALRGMTGIRTVPQIFLGAKLVGGCDDVVALQRKGALAQVVEEARKARQRSGL